MRIFQSLVKLSIFEHSHTAWMQTCMDTVKARPEQCLSCYSRSFQKLISSIFQLMFDFRVPSRNQDPCHLQTQYIYHTSQLSCPCSLCGNTARSPVPYTSLASLSSLPYPSPQSRFVGSIWALGSGSQETHINQLITNNPSTTVCPL